MADRAHDGAGSRPRALLWVLGVLTALTALYAFAGFVVLPRVARQRLIQYGAHALQAQVRVGAVHFNPFTLSGEISDFALRAPDGASLARFADLKISAAPSSLWQGITLRRVQLDQPALELMVDHDGILNWARLGSAGPTAAAAPQAIQRPLALRIEALQVHAGRIQFEDRSHETPFRTVLDPIELQLLDFRSTPEFRNRLHLTARTTAGESLDWNAEFSLQPFASSGTLQLSGLKAATIAAYLQDELPFAVPSGTLDAHTSYQWSSRSGQPQIVSLEQASLHDWAIAPHVAGTAPRVQLPALQLLGARVDLAQHHMQVQELRLQRPSAQIWREPSGTINLQQLRRMPQAAAPKASATKTAPGNSLRTSAAAAAAPAGPSAGAASHSSAPWTLDLQLLRIEQGTLALEDRSVQPVAKLRLSSIGLQLHDFSSSDTERPFALELVMNVGDGAKLQLDGSVKHTAALSAQLKLDLQRLDLSALQPYLARETNLVLYRGRLSAQAQVSYDAASQSAARRSHPQLDVSGRLSITDFATREQQSTSDLVNWQQLELSGVHYQRRPDLVSIEQVALRHAYGRVLIGSDGTLNIAQVLHRVPPGGASAAPAGAAGNAAARPVVAATALPASGTSATAQPLPIRIGKVEISGSTANFTDQSVRPTFSATILSLRGSAVGLSSAPEARAQVHLSGLVDRYAPVSIDGQVNLLAATAYSDLSLNFSNIDLTIFNPYSGKFAGYSIAQGKLATQMHYHVENGKLQATHHIVIDQLEFGPATENRPAVPLPVKLGAALLKDRHGVISIDLPVSGSVKDPSFRLGPLIGRALLGLLTKVVTAPFSWIGSLFGGGEQLAYLDFRAGSAEVRQEDRPKVARLAKALAERPQLKLDVPLHTISVADDRALAQTALALAVAKQSDISAAAAAGSRPRAHGRGAKAAAPHTAKSAHLLALEALYHTQFNAAPLYPADIAGASAGGAPPSRTSGPGGASARPAALPGAAVVASEDPRSRWLERQLMAKFLPNAAQRDALGRGRADAVEAAILAAAQLPPDHVFLTNRLCGGGAPGMSRMELQLQ